MMTCILYVYRILLPPVFFFGHFLGLSQETASGNHLIKNTHFQQNGQNYGAQPNLIQKLYEKDIPQKTTLSSLEHSAYRPTTYRILATESLLINEKSKTSQDLSNHRSFADINDTEDNKPSHEVHSSNQNSLDQHWMQLQARKHVGRKQLRQSLSKESASRREYLSKMLRRSLAEKHFSDIQLEPSSISVSRNAEKIDSNRLLGKRRAVNGASISDKVKHQPSHQVPPEFMVRLFQLLSGTRYQRMRNVVVTGFINIKDKEGFQDESQNSRQIQEFLFKVTLPQNTEIIHHAELRMKVILNKESTEDEYVSEKIDENTSHKISLFEIDPNFGRCLIASKNIKKIHTSPALISFNLTTATQKWTTSGLRFLEARLDIAKGNPEEPSNEGLDQGQLGDRSIPTSFVDLDIDTEEGNEPLLVIFSQKAELHESLTHKRNRRDVSERHTEAARLLNENFKENNNGNAKQKNNLIKDLPSNEQQLHDIFELLSTIDFYPTNQFKNNKFKVPMTELLEESISSKIKPTNLVSEYGTALNNAQNNITFLKDEDNFQKTDKFNANQLFEPDKQISKRVSDSSNRKLVHMQHSREIFNNKQKKQLPKKMFKVRVRRKTKRPYRRHLGSLLQEQKSTRGSRIKRSKKKRISCQRKEMYVEFETIKWDKVIIFPRGYQAFECTGKCFTPMSEYLTPTKHAIIQTLVHTSYPEQTSRACCVPTKLDPISILYWDENGDVKYDYSYEGMVVAECGCR